MTCRQARKLLLDGTGKNDTGKNACATTHLAGCEDCAREYAAIQATLASIQPSVRIEASPDFKERVMSKLTEQEAPVRRRLVFPRLVFVAGAAVLLMVLAPLIGNLGRGGHAPASVVSLLAQSAQAMAGARSVHMIARMRTTPTENFEIIHPDAGWVPIEIWSEAGPPARWRVEKPGRVVVMDGTSSMLVVKPDTVSRGTPDFNYLEWMRILLDPDQLMEKELDLARSGASSASVAEEDAAGTRHLVLTVAFHPRRWFSSDWFVDRGVSSSDHTRTYRFDPVTRRLEGMQMVMHSPGVDLPVFEITEVRYDEVFDHALFALAAPEKAISIVDPTQMPVTGPLPQSPKEAAVMLFDAFSREDWQAALVVFPMTGVDERFKKILGGLQVISIGEPFRSSAYAGWHVPYEVRLKSGRVLKANLAVRNDNSVGRWVWDGGL
ncbi:conserved hypothetical protein [Candidatus Sulfopaludibacter sp. SbA4]|nr:conserved hypothetical protein [Candidatus Sulfopaludibacter sp. SbA4]